MIMANPEIAPKKGLVLKMNLLYFWEGHFTHVTYHQLGFYQVPAKLRSLSDGKT